MSPLARRLSLRFRLVPELSSEDEGMADGGGGEETREGTGKREMSTLCLEEINFDRGSSEKCCSSRSSRPSDDDPCGSGSSMMSGTVGRAARRGADGDRGGGFWHRPMGGEDSLSFGECGRSVGTLYDWRMIPKCLRRLTVYSITKCNYCWLSIATV